MQNARSYRHVDLAAVAFLGACVAGLYGAALPDMASSLMSAPERGQHADVVEGTVPAAPLGRILGMTAHVAEQIEVQPVSFPVTELAPDAPIDVKTAMSLYRELDFGLEALNDEGRPVPRVFLASVPNGLHSMRDSDQRKTLFVQVMLPLILKVNEEIAADRERLLAIKSVADAKRDLSPDETEFVARLSSQYGLSKPDLGQLLKRVDVVPPSLALAQAAEESGWGTSRFARQGNSLFGQGTTDPAQGLSPVGRDDATFFIKSFPTLLEAVRSYAVNLNSHRAYGAFRAARASLRKTGQPLDGLALSATLMNYSEREAEYVTSLQLIMRYNSLNRFDGVALSTDPIEVADLETALP